jgi:phosphate starvation-inducible PhoH-like protein
MKKPKNANIVLYTPKTLNQKEYLKYLNNDNTKIIISTGPAGCGKTLFACQKAIIDLKSEEINKIIITRPVVSVDEELGFLPGNIVKKMDPWTRPIFDLFLEHYSKTELDLMLMNGKIEICPLAFMRGRTFKNSFIIADEMQNSSPNQMKMLATRLGEKSRMVITGDLQQTDITKENGLHDFVNRLEKFNTNIEMIKLIKMNNDDIERSEVVKTVIEIYENIVKNSTISPQNSTISPQNSTMSPQNTTITPQNTTMSPQQNTTMKKDNEKKINLQNNNDAALIPIQHISRNHDIFFNPNYF